MIYTPGPLESLPKLPAYWRTIRTDPIASRLVTETREAVAHARAAAKVQGERRALCNLSEPIGAGAGVRLCRQTQDC